MQTRTTAPEDAGGVTIHASEPSLAVSSAIGSPPTPRSPSRNSVMSTGASRAPERHETTRRSPSFQSSPPSGVRSLMSKRDSDTRYRPSPPGTADVTSIV